jgi:hypothetical protein
MEYLEADSLKDTSITRNLIFAIQQEWGKSGRLELPFFIDFNLTLNSMMR